MDVNLITDLNSYLKYDTNQTTGESNTSYENNNANSKENVDESSYDKKELDKAMDKVNDYLKAENLRTEYSKHKDLGTIMIKVVDRDTGKVVLEVPPKKILDMVASLCKEAGILDKKV